MTPSASPSMTGIPLPMTAMHVANSEPSLELITWPLKKADYSSRDHPPLYQSNLAARNGLTAPFGFRENMIVTLPKVVMALYMFVFILARLVAPAPSLNTIESTEAPVTTTTMVHTGQAVVVTTVTICVICTCDETIQRGSIRSQDFSSGHRGDQSIVVLEQAF